MKVAIGAPSGNDGPVPTPGQRFATKSSFAMDCTAASDELARVSRTLRTTYAANRTLLRATDEMALLNAMCQVVVETGGYRMAFVGYAMDDPEKSVVHVASYGADAAFLEVVPNTWADNEFGQTAIATAIRTGKPSVARHILKEQAFESLPRLREEVRKHGCSAVTALPLEVEGRIIGAMTVLAAEPEAFGPAEVELLSELGSDLSYGIASLRIHARHREAEATIERLAFYDSLTGLANRTLLMQKFEQLLAASRAGNRPALVLHLELIRFSDINRVLGYACGDRLLLELVHRVQSVLPPHAVFARLGECDFSVVMPGCASDAFTLARELIALMEEPVAIAEGMIDARIGVGIAMFPGHGLDAATLVRRAAAALHQSNHAYGGYAMHAGGQERDSTRRLRLIGDLHRAVRQHELQLFCQPKVDIASGALCGVEALVRWQHPEHGMIMPTEFIPVAEQAGTITPVTQWVMDAAFHQSYLWHQAGIHLPMAVNLSAHDLYNPHVLDRVDGLFSTWGLPPELIQFELTESALMAEPATALDTVRRLKDTGVLLYVDDFGTGYSGLSYLQRLPVDGIKIDQSFVMPMVSNSDSAVIVSSTIDLGHNLGLNVIAEGVESDVILSRLAELGCDIAQGYLIGKPMPAAMLQEWASGYRLHGAH
jgi:diguanylate cyclase (GGDEF)-like protein